MALMTKPPARGRRFVYPDEGYHIYPLENVFTFKTSAGIPAAVSRELTRAAQGSTPESLKGIWAHPNLNRRGHWSFYKAEKPRGLPNEMSLADFYREALTAGSQGPRE